MQNCVENVRALQTGPIYWKRGREEVESGWLIVKELKVKLWKCKKAKKAVSFDVLFSKKSKVLVLLCVHSFSGIAVFHLFQPLAAKLWKAHERLERR